MLRYRPITTDPEVDHLWLGDLPTETACHLAGEPLAKAVGILCPACIEEFGADVAEAFPEIKWLRARLAWSPPVSGIAPGAQGRKQHAFDPDPLVDGNGRPFAVCHMGAHDPDRLGPDTSVMRCPHCVAILRARLRWSR